MRLILLSLILSGTFMIPAHAQDEEIVPTLKIGDPAPPMFLSDWVKGNPLHKFEKGKVYVLEFWATWCAPCKAAIPHLSALAGKYKESVKILGIDVYENPGSLSKVKAFVDSMGSRMDYPVAMDENNKMVSEWIEASGVKNEGIPRTFIVNREGRLVWIGHPKNIDSVLEKVVNNKWDVDEALATRNLNKRLFKLDEDAYYQFINYRGDPKNPAYPPKPDSALLYINYLLNNEPNLKYAYHIARETFVLLLNSDPRKAYEYGKSAIAAPYYLFPAYEAITGVIELYPDSLCLPAEFYQLGAEGLQREIDEIPYPELANMPKRYILIAEWHYRSKDISKAIDAQQKAIEASKNRKNYSANDLAAMETRLREYKRINKNQTNVR